jgi:REP element-mobilizing transposase RayT
MPRSARKRSESNVYHVIVRGEGRQVLFEDDDDRRCFVRMLAKSVENAAAELWAWCLMSNHVHLLLRADFNRLPRLMQSLTSGYATYYNERHDHIGHVFSGRYKSIPVDTDEYLMTLVHYIHFNPVCEKLSKTCDYSWSSYNDYLSSSGITDIGFVLDVFGGLSQFKAFHESESVSAKPHALLVNAGRRLGDEEAREVAEQVLGKQGLLNLASQDRPMRDEGIVALKRSGLTIKQVERFTGIGRGIVARVKWKN